MENVDVFQENEAESEDLDPRIQVKKYCIFVGGHTYTLFIHDITVYF